MTEMREEYEQDRHSPEPMSHQHHHHHHQSACQDQASSSLNQQTGLWVKDKKPKHFTLTVGSCTTVEVNTDVSRVVLSQKKVINKETKGFVTHFCHTAVKHFAIRSVNKII